MGCKLACGAEVDIGYHGPNEGIKSCHNVTCTGGDGGSRLITHKGSGWQIWDPVCPEANPCPATPTDCSDTCAAMATTGISTASLVKAADGTCVKPNKKSCRKEACKAVGKDGILRSCGCRKKKCKA